MASLVNLPPSHSIPPLPPRPPPYTEASYSNTETGDAEVLIGIMGPTGCGKSTFINTAAQSNLRVGNGLESCTSVVQHAPAFELDGRQVILIDTPGFDDTNKSNTDILRMIALYLATTYESGKKLTGILYFHRISDFRMGGTSRQNFEIFKSLCGDGYLKNTLIVTNMWSQVDPQVGLSREKELITKEAFLKTAIDKGAQIARHEDTMESAHTIIRQMFKNKPAALQIQVELVDQKKQLTDTLAGSVLTKELKELAERHRKQMEELTDAMEDAIREKDEESRRELEEETLKLQQEMERVQKETNEMAARYMAEKAKLEAFVAAKVRAEAERFETDRYVDQLPRVPSASTHVAQRIENSDVRVKQEQRPQRSSHIEQVSQSVDIGTRLEQRPERRQSYEQPPQRVESPDRRVRQAERKPAQVAQSSHWVENPDRAIGQENRVARTSAPTQHSFRLTGSTDHSGKQDQRAERRPTQSVQHSQQVGSQDYRVWQEQRVVVNPTQFDQPPRRTEGLDRWARQDWRLAERGGTGTFERFGKYLDSFFQWGG